VAEGEPVVPEADAREGDPADAQAAIPEDFMREALGVWDDPGGAWDVIAEDAWGAAAVAGARM
jgi:hypothetical protein